MRAGVPNLRGFGVRRSAFGVLVPGVLLVPVLAAAAAGPARAEGQAPAINELLARVGERVAAYYKRAQSVICTEKSVVQAIGSNLSPEGFARTVESELHVEADAGDAPGEAKVVREIRRVNGRAPREKDNKERAGCTDPNPLSPEPLSFLLPAHRSEYVFTDAGTGKDKNRNTLYIDFASANRKSRLELNEDPKGRDGCFNWSGDVAVRGRVWVDAANYDVLRVDQRFMGIVDVRVPARLQRRYNFSNSVVVERSDVTIRYRTVSFSDPDETMLLPESIDMLMVIRGGLESTRRNQTFSDYRRFLTAGRVVK